MTNIPINSAIMEATAAPVQSHFREAPMAKNEKVIKTYIGNSFCQCPADKVPAIVCTYQQCIAHLVYV